MKALPAFLVLLGCHVVEEERTVWSVPLLNADHDVSFKELVELLGKHGISVTGYVGDRGGQRIWVSFEKHAMASAVLKSAPFARKVALNTIDGGPRPGRLAPEAIGHTSTNWIHVGAFARGTLDLSELLRLLNTAGCEAGLVTYGVRPEETFILTPEVQSPSARSALVGGPLRGRVRILP